MDAPSVTILGCFVEKLCQGRFMRSYFLFCLLCCLFPSALCAERLTPERLWDLRRIGDAAVSPDGERVAFLVTDYDLEANEGKTSLLLQPLSELTRSDKEAADRPAKRLAIGFDTTLAASETQTLLRGIKGLNSLAWLNHSTGPKLVYIAPGETPDASEEEIAADESSDPSSRQQTAQASPAEGDETGAEDENRKPQAW